MCREEFNEMLQREEFLADNVRLPEDLGTECPETIKQVGSADHLTVYEGIPSA